MLNILYQILLLYRLANDRVVQDEVHHGHMPFYQKQNLLISMINEVRSEEKEITSTFLFLSGVSGDPISIVANYIRILSKPSWQLFQYHIGKDLNSPHFPTSRSIDRCRFQSGRNGRTTKNASRNGG